MEDKEKDQVQGTNQPEEENAGFDRRRFLGTAGAVAVGALAGLSGGGAELMAASRGFGGSIIEWGPRVKLAGLREHFAPQQVRDYTVPAGGIDNMGLHSTDVFEIPGRGRFEVDFQGYFRVARSNPTSSEWGNAMLRVNIVDMRLFGQHEELGEIGVTLNPDILSSGQVFPSLLGRPRTKAEVVEPTEQCRIAVGAVFTLPALTISLFNKEPILLMNEGLRRIPPVNDPTGYALLFKLPLFNVKDPNGEPVAYLTSLKYGIDSYIDRDEVRAIRERRLREV